MDAVIKWPSSGPSGFILTISIAPLAFSICLCNSTEGSSAYCDAYIILAADNTEDANTFKRLQDGPIRH